MKVTKLIREYVEEEVGKVYDAKVNPYAEQAKLDYQKIKDFEEQLNEIKYKAVQAFILENGIYNRNSREPVEPSSNPSLFSWRTKAMLDEQDWKAKNNDIKKAKIREIMLALELGANRQELNEMIAKLLEDTE